MKNLEHYQYLCDLAAGGRWIGELAERELESDLGKDWEDKLEAKYGDALYE